ncbi:MAG: alpha/beta hydrolase [Gemmatimonadetes bacterium]|nr:alpha/beta hydrolase [Gemmatimonadota bacterium]
MTRHATLRDGRRIAWEEAGDPDGFPMIGVHGNPGSRLSWLLPLRDQDLTGCRIILPDRPGVGESDPHPQGCEHDWSADVAELADHLGADRFAIAGVSGGGPFALSVADRLRDRVSALALVATGPVLDELIREAPTGARLFFKLGRDVPGLMRVRSAVLAQRARRDPAALVQRTFVPYGAIDRAQLERPEVLDHLARDYAEAFRQGGRRSADEMVQYANPWPIPEDLPVPTSLWCGRLDEIVSPRATEYLAGVLPHAEFHEMDRYGHLWFLDHGAEVFRDLARHR